MLKVQEREEREKIKENDGEITTNIASDNCLLVVEEDGKCLNFENVDADRVVDS